MNGSWRNLARCRGVDPEIFHPVNDDAGADEAKAICAACAVREPCLEYALTTPREGRRLGRPDGA